MTLAETQSIYESIAESSFADLRRDLLLTAVRYARIRTDWEMASRERRLEIEEARTAAHNALIDACDILSRNMAKKGENNSWRARIGEDRRSIGDFACRLHCVLGLLAG